MTLMRKLARARGPPSVADRHLCRAPGLAGAGHLRALRRVHRRAPGQRARAARPL